MLFNIFFKEYTNQKLNMIWFQGPHGQQDAQGRSRRNAQSPAPINCQKMLALALRKNKVQRRVEIRSGKRPRACGGERPPPNS